MNVIIFRSIILSILVSWNLILNISQEKWIIKESSNVIVEGKTNVNTFICKIKEYGRRDTLTIDRKTAKKHRFPVQSTITIPISGFDCRNSIMTRDLQITLNSKKFPNMHITIVHLSEMLTSNPSCLNGQVDIILAGQRQSYVVEFYLKRHNRDFLLEGKQRIHFTDFNLKPPTKMGGTIAVKNELEVTVNLILQKI